MCSKYNPTVAIIIVIEVCRVEVPLGLLTECAEGFKSKTEFVGTVVTTKTPTLLSNCWSKYHLQTKEDLNQKGLCGSSMANLTEEDLWLMLSITSLPTES